MPNSSVVLVYWFFALLVCINIKNLSCDCCPDTVPGLLYVSTVLDSTLYFRSPIPAHEIQILNVSVDNTHVAYPSCLMRRSMLHRWTLRIVSLLNFLLNVLD